MPILFISNLNNIFVGLKLFSSHKAILFCLYNVGHVHEESQSDDQSSDDSEECFEATNKPPFCIQLIMIVCVYFDMNQTYSDH